MLGKLQALRLIVRAEFGAVELLGPLEHLLISEAADDLAVFEDERNLMAPDLEHGQTVCRLVYEKMAERPSFLYGTGIGSHYQAQGLKLSKHFR